MSCNGCRVLRKGCSENCVLRPCLQWIESPESQGHATVFVAKFFGRAGLMTFISNVPHPQRPALFQSLLYEACGRTVNPVSGAVGLLWTGNWHVCQAAVDTVLRGGTLRPISEFLTGAPPSLAPTVIDTDDNSEVACPPKTTTANNTWHNQISLTTMHHHAPPQQDDRKRMTQSSPRFTINKRMKEEQLDLSLTPPDFLHAPPHQRSGTPSLNSEESGATTVSFGSDDDNNGFHQPQLLKLFV